LEQPSSQAVPKDLIYATPGERDVVRMALDHFSDKVWLKNWLYRQPGRKDVHGRLRFARSERWASARTPSREGLMSRFGALMVGICLLCSGRAMAQDDRQEDRRTVTVTGSAAVYVVPDQVILGVGVETIATSVEEARRMNEVEGLRLLDALKKAGVPPRSIRTDMLVVDRKGALGYSETSTPGFVIRRGYTITLSDLRKYEQVVTVALVNGANRIMGAEFRDTRLREHRDEARRLAVKAAREKATLLANELGANVGTVRSINEYADRNWSNEMLSGPQQWWSWNSHAMQQQAMNISIPRGDEVDSGGSLPPGRIPVRAQVNVTFYLAP